MKAIVFIHGYLSSPGDFGDLPEQLKHDYDQIIEIVLPGHGSDDHIKNFTFEKALSLIDDELPQLFIKFQKIDLVGFSLGGAIARYLAAKYPVNRLVLLAPAVYYHSPFLLYHRLNYLFQTTTYLDLVSHSMTRRRLVRELNNKALELYNHDKAALKFLIQEILPKFNLANGLTFVKLISYMNKEKKPIKAPTLVIWGYLDELVPYHAAKSSYDSCINPNKQLLIVPHVGHMLLRSKYMDEIIVRIILFLKG